MKLTIKQSNFETPSNIFHFGYVDEHIVATVKTRRSDGYTTVLVVETNKLHDFHSLAEATNFLQRL